MKKSLTVGSLKPSNHSNNVSFVSKREMADDKGIGQPKAVQRLVKVKQKNQVMEIMPQSHKTVLQAALEQGLPIDYKCQKGTCGKCTVQVIKGSELLTSVNKAEEQKLENALLQGYRLACQAAVK